MTGVGRGVAAYRFRGTASRRSTKSRAARASSTRAGVTPYWSISWASASPAATYGPAARVQIGQEHIQRALGLVGQYAAQGFLSGQEQAARQGRVHGPTG